jgi:hypothetical protein
MKREIKEKWFALPQTKRFLIAAAVIVIFGAALYWLISGIGDFVHDAGYSNSQSELKTAEETQKSEAGKNLGAAAQLHNQTAELESEVLPAIKIRRQKAESDAVTARLKFDEKRKIYEKNRNRAADVNNLDLRPGAAPSDSELRAAASAAGIDLDDYK